jgi:15-cis-phytoene synthase
VHAVDLGIALQLTNILRDVGEDARNGRIYLPLEEMEQFGYSEADLMAGVINDAFCALIYFQMQRADAYYCCSLPGIDLLNADCRLAIRLSGTLYRRILDCICANNFDVFTTRARVSLPTKVMTASSHWIMQQFDVCLKGPHNSRRRSIVSSHS